MILTYHARYRVYYNFLEDTGTKPFSSHHFERNPKFTHAVYICNNHWQTLTEEHTQLSYNYNPHLYNIMFHLSYRLYCLITTIGLPYQAYLDCLINRRV